MSNILNLPKGDLHLHLNGAVPTNVLREMLNCSNIKIPEGFNLKLDLNVVEPKSSLSEYLKPWEVLNKIPLSRECLNFQVLTAVEKLKKQNVRFAELRNTIFYISELNKVSLEIALSWMIEALNIAEKITGVVLGLVITLNRKDLTYDKSLRIFDAVKKIDNSSKIVGFDLAGDEEILVSNDLGRFFKKVKEELGLGVTIHAGETGNINNIYQAIDVFCADRIGHANASVNDYKLLEKIKNNNIVVEVCPVSNLLTQAVKGENHSFVKFIEFDIPFVLCSDNPEIHKKSILSDYEVFLDKTGRLDIIKDMFSLQRKFTFIKGV
ncbi:adenosine deaminase [Acinetobacter courvalinii]|uniref:adenosine deaminase n=1 Tax=Acinetobacter courvalinii TaxID=280147 RepID=UPI0002D00143|nr:adenosine deaminase [Acinetobacter courvalinii]ENX09939.1 adenosine deaminase [Acinetobacter courvalinii]